MTTAVLHEKLMRLQTNMYNFALVLTSNRDEAYDLMQDTMLKVLDNTERYSDNTNFKGWVFTIMRNLFINNYRRTVRVASLLDTTSDIYNQLNLSQICDLEAPEGSFATHEITDAINRFPDEYRIPFSLHVAGFKYEEIAEKMELPLGTVKSRIYFARKRLQELFADYKLGV